MHVTLAKQHVRLTLQFDLAAILGLEEHAITDHESANIRPDRYHLGPGQTSTDFSGCGNHDSTSRATLAIWTIGADEHSIVEQLDGQRRIRFRDVNHGAWAY